MRTVIDLRTPGERERQPGSFENWRDIRVVPCSLLGESLDSFTGFMRSLGENYSEMIVRDRDHYRDLFEIILSENQRGGILFHCTAGKDRTGVTAALLLGLAGCEDADIVADYALTDIYLRPKVKLFLQHNPNADPALFRAPHGEHGPLHCLCAGGVRLCPGLSEKPGLFGPKTWIRSGIPGGKPLYKKREPF